MAVKKTFEFFFSPLLKKFFQDMGRDPNNLEMILLRQKAGQLLKDSNKVIPFKQKRSFAEEIEAMKKSGDIVDVDDIKISEKITDREMFKNSNLNKPTIEGQMDKINAASNRIKQIQKEQAEMYRPKTDAEIKAKFERQNKEAAERLRNKMKDEPEDKADGGRIGFRAGKFVLDKVIANLLGNKKKVQQAVDDIFPTGDYKMDAEMAADALVENNPAIFKNLLREDLSDEVSSEIYGAVLRPIMSNMAKMRELRKATKPEKTLQSMKEGKGIDMSNPDIADEFGKFMKETDPEGYKKLEQTVELSNFDPKGRKKNAKGGRAGFYTGGITDVEPSLDDIGHGSDSLMSRTRLMSPGSQTTTSTGLNYLLAEDNDNLRVPFNKAGFVYNPYRHRRLKESDSGFLDFFDLIGDDLSEEEFKQILQDLGVDKKAEGGRIGFSAGGGGRRAFLKLMATLGGGIAGIKTGLLGLGKGTTKKAITETVKQSAGSGTPPPYFFKLVEKIKTMGDDAVATQDKAIAKTYKDYVLEEDFAGNIEIKKTNYGMFGDEIAPTEEVYMSYRVDDVPVKGKKGSTKVEEYEEYTARPDEDGKMKDVEDGVPDDVVEEGTMFEDTMTEFGKTKKADGGRIGYVGGGLSKLGITGSSRRFLEKVFGKEKFQNLIENDPELHRGMLEVAEMFRSKDKSRLVEYMQNFLPQMSKKEIEAFVVGSGDTAGIEGQLIRLGSGRDYRNKLEMIKEAENVRKLKDFDIDDVSKNAEGGRIELKGGGDALKALIKYYANKKGVKGSTFLKDINPKALPQGIENIMGPEHMKMLKENQTGYLESLLSIIKSDKQFLDNVNNRVKEMVKTAPEGFEDVAENIANQMVKSSMKDKRFERMKVYDKIDIDDAIVDVEQMIKNRRVKESDGRALNASGGIQTMLGE